MLPDYNFLQSIKHTLRGKGPIELEEPCTFINWVPVYGEVKFTSFPWHGRDIEGKYIIGRKGTILKLVNDLLTEESFDYTKRLTEKDLLIKAGWPQDYASILARVMIDEEIIFEELFNRIKEVGYANNQIDIGKIIKAIDVYVLRRLEYFGYPKLS